MRRQLAGSRHERLNIQFRCKGRVHVGSVTEVADGGLDCIGAAGLAQDRAEAVRQTAAEAYAKASEYLGIVNDDTVHDLARNQWLPEHGVAVFEECQRQLTLMEGMGWSDQVRFGAVRLRVALSQVRNAGLVAIMAIRSTIEDEQEAMGSLSEVFEEAEGALADFQIAIAK